MGYWVSVRVKLHRNGFHICSQNIVPWLCYFCSASQRKKEEFWSLSIRILFFLKIKICPILVLLFLLLTSGESQSQSSNLFLIITIRQSNREVMAAQSEKTDLPQCGSIAGTKWSCQRKQTFYPLAVIVSHIQLKEM